MEGFSMCLSKRSKLTLAFQIAVAAVVFVFITWAPLWLTAFVLFLDFCLTPDCREEMD
jgi:hypothetical protein